MFRKLALAAASWLVSKAADWLEFPAQRFLAEAFLLIAALLVVYAGATWDRSLDFLRAARLRFPKMTMALVLALGGMVGVAVAAFFLFRVVGSAPASHQPPADVVAIRQPMEQFRDRLIDLSGQRFPETCGPSESSVPAPIAAILDDNVSVAQPIQSLRESVRAVRSSPLYQPTKILHVEFPRKTYATVAQRWRSVLSSSWLLASKDLRCVNGVNLSDRRALDDLFAALDEAENAVAPNGAASERTILRYQLGQYLMRGSMLEQAVRDLLQPVVDGTGRPVDNTGKIAGLALDIQDWQFRLSTFVRTELGEIALARLMNFSDARPMPAGLFLAFEHSWRSLVVGLARIDEWLKEYPELPAPSMR